MWDYGPVKRWSLGRSGSPRSGASGSLAGWVGVLPAEADIKAALPAAWHWLAGEAQRERDARRPFLWLPVAMACGILLYFSASDEPLLLAPVIAAILAAALAFGARDRYRLAFGVCVGLCALFVGFAAAAWRTAQVAAPVLERPKIGRITGYIESADIRTSGTRLLIRPVSIEGLSATQLPFRIRVTVPGSSGFEAGAAVLAVARLLPPPEPSRPGGYDFAREAFFMRIGAVGSISGRMTLAPALDAPSWDLRANAAVDRWRNALTARIAEVIGGPAGAVAAALVTGKRGLIPEATNDDLRAAGIYHVVSISGLHMVLAAGMVFWIVRAMLVAVPHLALAYPVKKWAALAAMAAGVVYNVFAGSEIATQRSLIMTLVLLGAILADRPALSMRNLAIAAIAVLLLEPESLLGPSFQMSFGAVAALIALYERPGGAGMEPEAGHFSPFGLDQARAEKPPPVGLVGRVLRKAWIVAVGAVLTTLVAEAATAPFGLYHFQRFTPYGVVGNALTLPLVSIVVMPAALLGVLAIPFGLDSPVWSIMGIGVDLMLRVSSMVAGWTGSIRTVQAFGAGALLLLSLATLCATLWRGWLRLGAIPLALAGMLLASRSVPPDLVIDRDGRALAARAPDGRLAMVGRLGSFVVEQWLRADGDARTATDPSLFTQSRCDPSGCILIMPDGRALAHILSQAAFEEDCRRAAIIVTPLDAPSWCKPSVLIDRSILAKNGAQAINLSTNGATAASGARSDDVHRPWIARPRLAPPAGSSIAAPRSSNQARPGPAAAPAQVEIGAQDAEGDRYPELDIPK